MSLKSKAFIAIAAFSIAVPASAEILIKDAYARVSSPAAKSGAAFMAIANSSDTADRLIGLKTDIAAKAELHTHRDAGDGVMKMMHVEEGFHIPAGGMHLLERGGDHLMFMGLSNRLAHGDTVNVTLIFEGAGEISVEIPVDLERESSGHGSNKGEDHSAHKHH